MSSDPVAILAERAGIPDRRIDRRADKPTEQQVVIQLRAVTIDLDAGVTLQAIDRAAE
jgi:hypothetical protein